MRLVAGTYFFCTFDKWKHNSKTDCRKPFLKVEIILVRPSAPKWPRRFDKCVCGSYERHAKALNIYTFWQISHFGWKLIKNIKKSLEMDWIKQTIPKRHEQLYVVADVSFCLESIKNIKKSYMFWNGLNKTENPEKMHKAIRFDRFLVLSWNWSKTSRNPMYFEMNWIKQKILKRHNWLYMLLDFSFRLKVDTKH